MDRRERIALLESLSFLLQPHQAKYEYLTQLEGLREVWYFDDGGEARFHPSLDLVLYLALQFVRELADRQSENPSPAHELATLLYIVTEYTPIGLGFGIRDDDDEPVVEPSSHEGEALWRTVHRLALECIAPECPATPDPTRFHQVFAFRATMIKREGKTVWRSERRGFR